MATLADHSPSSDEEVGLQDLNLRKSIAPNRFPTIDTLAPSMTPRKNVLIPKSSGSVSPRKVRKLGSQSAQGLVNPLFRPWSAEDRTGFQSRTHSVMMESPKKLGLVTEFEQDSPPQTIRRPRHRPSFVGLPTLDTRINLKLEKISRYSMASGRKSSCRLKEASGSPPRDGGKNEGSQQVQGGDTQASLDDNSCTSSSDSYQADSDSFRAGKDDPFSMSSDSDDILTSGRRVLNPRRRGKKRIVLPTLNTLGNPRASSQPAQLGGSDPLRPRSRRTMGSRFSNNGVEGSFASSQTHDSFEENTIFSERYPTNGQHDNLLSRFGKLNLDGDQKLKDGPKRNDASATPPVSPMKGLASPRKLQSIPQAPYRPSEQNPSCDKARMVSQSDENSPSKSSAAPASLRKPQTSPQKGRLKEFNAKKHSLAESFLHELDIEITGGEIGELAKDTGGIGLIWTKTLNTTAGRANWRRETTYPSSESASQLQDQHRHYASIELAEKVIDNENKLLNVIAHEFCHLANFMISGVTKNPHGHEFKSWAAKCSARFNHRGIQVTTKHTYDIDFKYIWECTKCGQEYKRHSKSIDTNRHRCGGCKSQLKQLRPARKAQPTRDSKPSEYQNFMRTQMRIIRTERPGLSQKELMGIIAEKWATAKTVKLRVEDEPDEESVSAMLAEQLGC